MPARWVPPHLGFLPGHNKEGARSSRVKDEAQGSASKRTGLIKAISPRGNGRRDAVMVKRTMQLGEVPYCPACRGHDCWARLRWVSSSSALLLLAPGTWHSPCLSSALARGAATLQITFWGLRHSPQSHTKAPLLHKRSLREPGASLPLLAGSRRQCWEQEQCSVAKAGPREQLAGAGERKRCRQAGPGCKRRVGFPTSASTEVSSIVSARNRQPWGSRAASCSGAARKRIQLRPPAAPTPPAARSPGEPAGLKDTASLLRHPTAPGFGHRRLPTSRQPVSQADAVPAWLAPVLSRGEKEARVEPQGWGGWRGLHAEPPVLLLRWPMGSGGAGKHVLKPAAASHGRPGAFPRAGPAATTAGGSWWRATSTGDPVARGAGWHMGLSPRALLQLRAMCGWPHGWGGTPCALVKPRTPPTRVREPGVWPQNHAPAGTPTIS